MKKVDYVYIVEDDNIASFVIKLELDNNSAFSKNEVFSNGKIAFDELVLCLEKGGKIPDLILLDINMPVMDGWEFLEVFSRLTFNKKISVLILTSSINPEDVEKSKIYNVVKGFFSKPLTSGKLDEILALV